MAYIYCIENIINNKRYVGKNVGYKEKRWYDHRSKLKRNKHLNYHLQCAWNKYGEDNFHFSIIEECPKELLYEREIFWIMFYDSFNNGYNLTKGGDGLLGRVHTKETKLKIGKSREGNTDWLGKHHTDETKLKMSVWQIGRKFSKESKTKMSEAKIGTHHTSETKTKMSEAKIGNKNRLGTFDSEKTKTKKSLSQKLRWEKYRREKGSNID